MLVAFDPVLVPLFDGVGIHWYGLIYIMAMLSAFGLVSWMARRQNLGLTADKVWPLILILVGGAFVGGRLGYCLLYDPSLFWKFRDSLPFWGVLAVFDGGLSIHGAFFGGWISLSLFAWQNRLSLPYLLDLGSLAASLMIVWMRLGNFLSGEILGRACDLGFPYAMKFPQEILFWPHVNPEKLKSLGSVVSVTPGVSYSVWTQSLQALQSLNPVKSVTDLENIQDILEKIILQTQIGNSQVQGALESILTLRYPAQLLALGLEGLLLFFILFTMWYRPQRSGVITGFFLILYSSARYYVETFREPDWHLGYLVFGLTMGQILSVGFFLIGLWFLSFYGRKDSVHRPGWGLGAHVKLHRR